MPFRLLFKRSYEAANVHLTLGSDVLLIRLTSILDLADQWPRSFKYLPASTQSWYSIFPDVKVMWTHKSLRWYEIMCCRPCRREGQGSYCKYPGGSVELQYVRPVSHTARPFHLCCFPNSIASLISSPLLEIFRAPQLPFEMGRGLHKEGGFRQLPHAIICRSMDQLSFPPMPKLVLEISRGATINAGRRARDFG